MALGAQRDQLLQLVLFDGLRLCPTLFGIGLGLLLRFAAAGIFQSEPLSGVIATLLAVAVRVCLAPTRRASRLNPLQVLRTEWDRVFGDA